MEGPFLTFLKITVGQTATVLFSSNLAAPDGAIGIPLFLTDAFVDQHVLPEYVKQVRPFVPVWMSVTLHSINNESSINSVP